MNQLLKLKSVLIIDGISSKVKQVLETNGIDAHWLDESGLSQERLLNLLVKLKVNGLFVRSATKVSGDVIKAVACPPNCFQATGESDCSHLQVIFRAGVGVDNIDVAVASSVGICVVNAPNGNTLSAVEHTCCLIMALARQLIPTYVRTPKTWRSQRQIVASGHQPVTELLGKTLGLIGLGRIGSNVGKRMHSFGMRVIAFDVAINKDNYDIRPDWLHAWVALEQIWTDSDYISLHVSLNAQTRGMVDSTALSNCRPGFKLVNCARGGLIDETALLEALENGNCAGAALDVLKTEPPLLIHNICKERSQAGQIVGKLMQHPNVIITPHLGGSSSEAQIRLTDEVTNTALALNGSLPLSVETFCSLEAIVNFSPAGRCLCQLEKLQTGLISQLLQITKLLEISFVEIMPDMWRVSVSNIKLDGLASNQDQNFAKQLIAGLIATKMCMKAKTIEASFLTLFIDPPPNGIPIIQLDLVEKLPNGNHASMQVKLNNDFYVTVSFVEDASLELKLVMQKL